MSCLPNKTKETEEYKDKNVVWKHLQKQVTRCPQQDLSILYVQTVYTFTYFYILKLQMGFVKNITSYSLESAGFVNSPAMIASSLQNGTLHAECFTETHLTNSSPFKKGKS